MASLDGFPLLDLCPDTDLHEDVGHLFDDPLSLDFTSHPLSLSVSALPDDLNSICDIIAWPPEQGSSSSESAFDGPFTSEQKPSCLTGPCSVEHSQSSPALCSSRLSPSVFSNDLELPSPKKKQKHGGKKRSSSCVSPTDSGIGGESSTSHSESSPSSSDGVEAATTDTKLDAEPFKPTLACRVCSDRASGYHYGVTACEGCKGFFRRSIQKRMEYKCIREGTCEIQRTNRNRCQFCRFKKCLIVGMSRESVRYGRSPRRSKSVDAPPPPPQAPNATTHPQQASQPQQLQQPLDETKQAAAYKTLLAVSQAHQTHCSYTVERLKVVVPTRTFLLDIMDPNPIQRRLQGYKNLALLLTAEIQSVVEFGKRLPEFLTLSQDDQLVLVKRAFFEIWLVRVARMFDSVSKTLTFSNGAMISEDQLESVYDRDFVNALFAFCANFNTLQLSDTEIGLLTALLLSDSGRQGLSAQESVARIHASITDAFKLHLTRARGPSEVFLYAAIMSKLAELRLLSAMHEAHIQWLREHWHQAGLPPLFSEVFDIPKVRVQV